MNDFVYLSKVERFDISPDVLSQTRDLLAEPGQKGLEACVLWAGHTRSETHFEITTPIFPSQAATPLDFYVQHSAVNEVFDRLAAERLVLAGQVHTHPGDAFHSLVDDAFPLATQVGSLSLVVPDFAAGPLKDLSNCAVYRLSETGWAGPIAEGALRQLIHISSGDEQAEIGS